MPARSEIDDKFKWAVSDLYSSDEAWEKDYNSILELTDQPRASLPACFTRRLRSMNR
mgnify:CR=1 FL=1